MSAFHEVSLPLPLALGAVGGPERRTEIVGLASGREERNSPWAFSRRRWDVGVALSTLDELAGLIAFFEARRGPLHGFRFRDPVDHRSSLPSAAPGPLDQPLGTGDGAATQFQLTKRYESGGAIADRPIVKPTAGSARVAVDSVEALEGPDFTVDATTGLVTFNTPPVAGAALTAGFTFDTPVRFEAERLDINLDTFNAGDAPAVPIVELRF
ncbi:MAG: DUF2460 domain-containing protein [Caulobacterales bacterium]|nr:DUF2460 domain-containing protein [Caulobacterales bacterium]